ncbi:FBP domain-containing protein [Allonocardiopsis opalescens]|uniref:Treble-clef zinc-finger protein n=1 Tax=Allonocardiopsis opalescens TaxID=1144618 RepID=A0A2T0Q5A5_9ACTN|nr:FBP domain-containing protein [Allonocardiopsis opalescens]PRX98962.1 treble-clef zinc-finger protein [Allonocardiopsis opalescens]
MRPITESDIRGSFVNCSKGEAKRLSLPGDLGEPPWADLDFLGWRDPGAPDRGYLVAERDGGELVGIALRATRSGSRAFTARSMCSLCLTTHTSGGVALMTARRAGDAGRQGNSVGQYLCTDLACSLYTRGRRQPSAGRDYEETLSVDDRILRTRGNLAAFVDRVLA